MQEMEFIPIILLNYYRVPQPSILHGKFKFKFTTMLSGSEGSSYKQSMDKLGLFTLEHQTDKEEN